MDELIHSTEAMVLMSEAERAAAEYFDEVLAPTMLGLKVRDSSVETMREIYVGAFRDGFLVGRLKRDLEDPR